MARSKREGEEGAVEPTAPNDVITAAKFVKTADVSPGVATILLQRDRGLWFTQQEWEQRVADLTH